MRPRKKDVHTAVEIHYNTSRHEHTPRGGGASDGCRPKLHRWPFGISTLCYSQLICVLPLPCAGVSTPDTSRHCLRETQCYIRLISLPVWRCTSLACRRIYFIWNSRRMYCTLNWGLWGVVDMQRSMLRYHDCPRERTGIACTTVKQHAIFSILP